MDKVERATWMLLKARAEIDCLRDELCEARILIRKINERNEGICNFVHTAIQRLEGDN